jgi:predicted nuclease of predicted toxin-antitoxin system
MHPFRFPLLADENIHDEVVHYLRKQGLPIDSIKERNLRGSTDNQIIDLAQKEEKVIITHDADFGRIQHLSENIRIGIIFLKPGHIHFSSTIQTIESLLTASLEVDLPFILVAERSGENIKIRVRNL